MLALYGGILWRQRAEVRREWADLLVLGALGMWICGAFVYIGGRTTTATNIGLIYAGVPVLIMLMAAVVFRERLSGAQLLGAAIALAGVLTIVLKGDPATLVRLDFVVGDLWVATAAFCWAVYSIGPAASVGADPLTRLAAITPPGY
jgi:drug/metabolite transporter (DMT)-like permease